MKTDVKELEQVVAHLPKRQLNAFRLWFHNFDAELWDKQIEKDAGSGALDHLADRALRDLADGRCTDL
ncbi:MAG: hypothetical protein WCI03_13395 [bacterium]|jgi:hypothetical protein